MEKRNEKRAVNLYFYRCNLCSIDTPGHALNAIDTIGDDGRSGKLLPPVSLWIGGLSGYWDSPSDRTWTQEDDKEMTGQSPEAF